MNEQWKSFLSDHGAMLESGVVGHFGDPAAELQAVSAGTVLCDLSHLGLIRVRGEDARGFLHNQLSNDVSQLMSSVSQLTSYNSPKGRMYAVIRLFMRDDDFLLSLPRELTETVLNRLRMFVLTSKVTLEDAGDELVGLGVAGTEAEALLASRLDAIPGSPGAVAESGPLSVLRIEGPAPRFQVFGPIEAVSGLWEALSEEATPVGEDAWVLQDIRAGLPVVHLQTREAFVPQMANLQLVNGVSFTKGCYPGQEIVARMQYLGTLKRRMYRAYVESEQRPLPGQEIFGAGSAEAQGTVVEARPDPDGGYQLLAVLNIAAADAGDLHLGDPSGPALRLEDLPYAFDEQRKALEPGR